MELLVFNKLNCNVNSRTPKTAKIRVSRQLGIVYINSKSLEIMKLKVDDFVEFLLSPERPVTWYIRKTGRETGLRISKNGGSGKVANRKIAESILFSYNQDSDNPCFPLSSAPTTFDDSDTEAWCIVNRLMKDAR